MWGVNNSASNMYGSSHMNNMDGPRRCQSYCLADLVGPGLQRLNRVDRLLRGHQASHKCTAACAALAKVEISERLILTSRIDQRTWLVNYLNMRAQGSLALPGKIMGHPGLSVMGTREIICRDPCLATSNRLGSTSEDMSPRSRGKSSPRTISERVSG